MKSIKYIKFAITAFYLLVSYWVTCLIFEKEFAATTMKHAVDSQYENTLMILLVSTAFSAVGIFLLGLLSIFTHYVFTKLIFADEVKYAALLYLKNRRKNTPKVKKTLITEPMQTPLGNEMITEPMQTLLDEPTEIVKS